MNGVSLDYIRHIINYFISAMSNDIFLIIHPVTLFELTYILLGIKTFDLRVNVGYA